MALPLMPILWKLDTVSSRVDKMTASVGVQGYKSPELFTFMAELGIYAFLAPQFGERSDGEENIELIW